MIYGLGDGISFSVTNNVPQLLRLSRFPSIDVLQRSVMLWIELQHVNGVLSLKSTGVAPKFELLKFYSVDINSQSLSKLSSLKPQGSCTPRSLL
jgi:hypothetical protein